jgi:hypothetical protein
MGVLASQPDVKKAKAKARALDERRRSSAAAAFAAAPPNNRLKPSPVRPT